MDKDVKIDCKRIQHIANKHGIKLNLNECEKLWEDFSEKEFSAGWMDLNIFDLNKVLVPLFKKLPCKYCDLKNYEETKQEFINELFYADCYETMVYWLI